MSKWYTGDSTDKKTQTKDLNPNVVPLGLYSMGLGFVGKISQFLLGARK